MNKIRLLLPIGFFSILMVGLVSHFLMTDKTISEMENRTLAKAPSQPTLSDVVAGEWSAEYETYFSDQFPGRRTLLKMYVQSELALGKTYIDDKYYADKKSGWITARPADLQPVRTLEASADKVIAFKEELDAQNIPFTFFSLPAKATYVTEPHPDFMPKDRGIDNNNKFLELLSEKGVDTVRLMDTVQSGGQIDIQQLYFKTDHHWNMNGAFLNYQAMILELAKRTGQAIKPLSLENTEKTCLPNEFSGSWNKAFYLLIPNDDQICYQEPTEFEDQFTIYMGDITAKNEVERSKIYALGKNLVEERTVSYSVGYSADYGEINILNSKYDSDEHLVLIKDSYINPIQYHIASHFKKTTIIDLRYLEENISDYLKTLQPSYVIMAYNDRNFDLGW